MTRRTLIRRGSGLAVAATVGPAVFPFEAHAANGPYSWYAYNTNETHTGGGSAHSDQLPQMDRMFTRNGRVPLYRTMMNKVTWENSGRNSRVFDNLVGHAIDRGISLVPILTNIASTGAGYPVLSDWRTFCQQMASRYGQNGSYYMERGYSGPARIRFWEVWNEQNIQKFWINPASYAPLLVESAVQIRSRDSNARIIFGGMASSPSSGTDAPLYYRQVHESYYDLPAYYHHVGVHSYPPSYLTVEQCVSKTTNALSSMMSQMDRWGATPHKLWLNEFSVQRRTGEYPGYAHQAGYCDQMLSAVKWYRGAGSRLGPVAWWPFAESTASLTGVEVFDRPMLNGLIASKAGVPPNYQAYTPAYNSWFKYDEFARKTDEGPFAG